MMKRYVKPNAIFRDKKGQLLRPNSILTDGEYKYTIEAIRPDFAVLKNTTTNDEILVITEEVKAKFEVIPGYVIRARGARKW